MLGRKTIGMFVKMDGMEALQKDMYARRIHNYFAVVVETLQTDIHSISKEISS